jgi:hypothetical protein
MNMKPRFVLIGSVCLIATCASLLAQGATTKTAPAKDAMNAGVEQFSASGTLEQIILDIQKLAPVKMVVDWDALRAIGVKPETVVTLAARQTNAGALLDLALSKLTPKGHPLTWYIQDEAVRVTTQQSFVQRRSQQLLLRAVTAGGNSPATRPAPGTNAGAPLREIAFDGLPLADALDALRRMANVNMHVNWQAMGTSNIDRTTPVSLRATGISVARAMDLIMDDLNAGKDKYQSVYWVVDDGIVVVSTGTALDTQARVKVLSVADLLMVVPDFATPALAAIPSNGSQGSTGNAGNTGQNVNSPNQQNTQQETGAETRQRAEETLISAIRNSIGQEMWEPQGKGSIRVMNKNLIISQTLLGFKLMEKASAR